MINEIVDLLKKSIGKEFRYANLNTGAEGIIEDIHMSNNVLSINDIKINLEEYTFNKILDTNLVSLHSNNLGTAAILIK